MIPPSAIIVKFVSQNVEGLIHALNVYEQTDHLVYSLAILSHSTGVMITNRSQKSGEDIVNYLTQFESNGSLQDTTIVVSRELLSDAEARTYVKQPFSPRLSLTPSVLQLPAFFISGEAKRDGMAISSSQRDYLFSSSIKTADNSAGDDFIATKDFMTNQKYFNNLNTAPNSVVLDSCCVIGLFPKTKNKSCEVLIKNQNLLILDNDFGIYFSPNGYGNLTATMNLNMSRHNNKADDITVINEKNDLSEVVKKAVPAPCTTGQLIQFNFLSGNALNCFSHLYIATYINEISKSVWLRKAFSAVGGETTSKNFSDFADEDVWVFNIKYQ